MKVIRVLVVDDQRSVREGLRMLLNAQADIAVVGEAEDGPGALATLGETQPDVVLLDYEMPGMNGVETLEAMGEAGNKHAVVMLSLHDDVAIRQTAGLSGAFAFVAKHEAVAVLLLAIRNAATANARNEDTS